MLNDSAAYYNRQNDLYKVVKSALSGSDRQLDEILKVLTDIKDLLVTMNGATSGKEDL